MQHAVRRGVVVLLWCVYLPFCRFWEKLRDQALRLPVSELN
jgi:hypothetical protein